MAKFKIGERARILFADAVPEVQGLECIIMGIEETSRGTIYSIYIPGHFPPAPKKSFGTYEKYLEKISRYDGWQKTQWADCPWRPGTKVTGGGYASGK